MGWNPSPVVASSPFDRNSTWTVQKLFENYRQRCISTCLLYPTFRSSSVIMTISTARTMNQSNGPPGVASKGDLRRLDATAASRPLPPPPLPPPPQDQGSAFLRFWWTDTTRETFLSHLPTDDLSSFRRACHDFSVRAAPVLFDHLTITFRASTFTRPARMAALERIGHHVRTLTFRMPHTAETFLPPLLDPVTGAERQFVYQPQTGGGSGGGSGTSPTSTARPALPGPKYGSWEMTDILTKQYGPLFHAATNVPAFIRAFTAMPGIEHIEISCPNQEPSQRYRRSVVDYALISLRMAVERAPLTSLSELSLRPMHAGGLLYLQSHMGFGASPKGKRRWAQIRRLTIQLDSWAFDGPGVATDHLKLLHQYLLSFSAGLEHLSFRWRGKKGPCPYTLDTEPVLPPRSSTARLRRMRCPRLQHADLSNAYPDASQLSRFIKRHRHSLLECDFDEVELRSGDWDEALAVLTRISGSDRWRDEQVALESPWSTSSLDEYPPEGGGTKTEERGGGGGNLSVGTDDLSRRPR
ncbi:MAG: hypothetical protein M1823_000903 [Watsoniomyces obsoletus]|nr:MAG: hypothetical protein M1823_000903 [Watsoniomyces obsoletus]